MIYKKYILSYFSMLIVFLIFDFVWLWFVAKDIYFSSLSHLLAKEVNIFAAILFYLVFVLWVLNFVVLSSIEKKSNKFLIINWLFFWFVTYATYDLTNFATLENFPLNVVIIDLIWGSFICLVCSFVWFYIYNTIK